MNAKEYIEIMGDLDGYIDRGGKLSDIELHDLSALPPAFQKLIADELGHERVARLGRFFQSAGALIGDDQPVGKSLTEEDLRAVWRASVNAAS